MSELDRSSPESQQAANKFSPAAKTLMELNALQVVGRDKNNNIIDEKLNDESPRLIILNPNLILGPQLQPGNIKGNSLPWFCKIIKGESMNKEIPNDSMSIIDVRDLAALHVAASEEESASGRYFGVNRSWPWKEILTAMAQVYPPYQTIIPPLYSGEANIETMFDNTRRDSLGIQLRSLETTLSDLINFLKEKNVL